MADIVNPLVAPDLWDKIQVAGVENPGLFVLAGGGSRQYSWDLKEPQGGQGGFATYKGWALSDGIKAKFKLWTPEQIALFYSTFLPLLQYDATKQEPKPVAVYHPALYANGITSVIVKDIGPLTDEGAQMWVVDVEMAEFAPPPKKNATATPKESSGNSGYAAGNEAFPTAEDQQQEEIRKLAGEAGIPVPDFFPGSGRRTTE